MRPPAQQLEMALAIAEAIEGSHHLAIEAGTGCRKSFAYLVPLIQNAVAAKDSGRGFDVHDLPSGHN